MENANEVGAVEQENKDYGEVYNDAAKRLEEGESPDSVIANEPVEDTKESTTEVDPNVSTEKEPVPEPDELDRLKTDRTRLKKIANDHDESFAQKSQELDRLRTENSRLEEIAKDKQASFTRKSQELAELKRKALLADLDTTRPEMLEDPDLEASIKHVVKREEAVRDIDKEIADNERDRQQNDAATAWGKAVSDVHPDASTLYQEPDIKARMDAKFKEWNGDYSNPSLAIREFNDIKAERADIAKKAAIEKAVSDYKTKQGRLDQMKFVTGGLGANISDDEAAEVKKIREMPTEQFLNMIEKATS